MSSHRMKYWAIRHIPTGYYLPEVSGGLSGKPGYTSTTPTNPKQLPPRLFTTAGGAKKALTWWLKGRIWVSHNLGQDIYGEYYDPDWHEEKMSDRKAEDMEVVPMILKRAF